MRFIHPNVEKCAYCSVGNGKPVPPLPFSCTKKTYCAYCQAIAKTLVEGGYTINYLRGNVDEI